MVIANYLSLKYNEKKNIRLVFSKAMSATDTIQ